VFIWSFVVWGERNLTLDHTKVASEHKVGAHRVSVRRDFQEERNHDLF